MDLLTLTDEQRLLYELAKKDVEEYKKQGKFAKLDMHIHSTLSDGKFSIPQIITMAKEFGLETIFITDHNTCLPGFNLVNSLSKSFIGDLEVRVGCEIACKIKDPKTKKFIPIEILSYYGNVQQIQAFLDKYNFSNNISQEDQLKTLLTTCDKIGLVHSTNIVIPKGCFATEILGKDLIKFEENKSYFMKKAPNAWKYPKLFYKMCVANPESEFYIDTTTGLPHFADVILEIVKAGGYAILAHPFLYSRNSEDEVQQLMDKISQTTLISGFEAIHSAHNEKQRKFIINYATTHKLYYTGGTDFHSGSSGTILGYGQKSCPVLLTKSRVSFVKNY